MTNSKILLYKGTKLFDIGNNILLGTALVDMYAKCGELTEAREILQCLTDRDVVTWSALISGYAQHGQAQEALKCFESMQSNGLCPSTVSYACTLKACGMAELADKGRKLHSDICIKGLETNIFVENSLVFRYGDCN